MRTPDAGEREWCSVHEEPLFSGDHSQVKVVFVGRVVVRSEHHVKESVRYEFAEQLSQLRGFLGWGSRSCKLTAGLGVNRSVEVLIYIEKAAVSFDEATGVNRHCPHVTRCGLVSRPGLRGKPIDRQMTYFDNVMFA